MGMIQFDTQYAMFDTTPVENRFLLEFMPQAKAEYVKVYLYGLMLCYHPQEDMSVTQMSNELNMTEEDVRAAYRHWERMGLVRRVSDHPATYQYLGVNRQFFMGAQPMVDPAYEAFTENLYATFGGERNLHSKEIGVAYEWVEDLGLPPEVVMMLVKHMIAKSGKNFSFSAAQKMAVELAERKVKSIEDAETVLERDQVVWKGASAIVRRFGSHRNPTKDEQNLYETWMYQWGFSHDAIVAACAETTRAQNPSFKYLNGILQRMKEDAGRAYTSAAQVEDARKVSMDEIVPLKKLLSTLNVNTPVSDVTKGMYRSFRDIYSDDDIILIAGRQVAERPAPVLGDVGELLARWKQRGLKDANEVAAYVDEVKRLDRDIKALFARLGLQRGITETDRDMVRKWMREYHFPWETVLGCSDFARDAKAPMPYLNSILADYAAKGMRDLEQIQQARKNYQPQQAQNARKGGKVVHEQQYEQREYTNDNNAISRLMNGEVEV